MSQIAVSAVRRFRVVWAVVLAVALAGLSVGSVGAYSNVSETGMVGPWSLNDTSGTPGANCGYSRQYPPNYAYFRWMKVKPPVVYAADRNSEKIDHKRVKWYWKLQRAHYGMNDWKTLRTSNTQTATAYENQPANFSAMRIDRNVGTPAESDVIFRAKVFIKWVKADGSVEGTAKATIDWYKGKLPWGDAVFGNQFCPAWATSG